MANTGNITITTSVTWTVGGSEFNVSVDRAINNGQKPINQVVEVPTASEVELLKIGSAGVAGELADIDFFIVINRDQNNDVRIRTFDTGGHAADYLIPPNGVFITHDTNLNVSATAAAWASWQTIDTISAQFDTADGEVEIIAGRV